MWISPQNTVLLTTTNPLSDGPLAWISGYAKSRVVAIQLGHGREAHLEPGYRALVRNAICVVGWPAAVTAPGAAIRLTIHRKRTAHAA